MTRARPVPLALPHAALPLADWADCYEMVYPDRELNAEQAALLALGTMPGWVQALMQLRNRIVGVFGLKPAPDPTLGRDGTIGAFPVISRSASEVVLGLDDSHLDFRLVITAEADGGEGTRARVATLVHRKNLFGRFYLAVVTPFHKVIVPSVLNGST